MQVLQSVHIRAEGPELRKVYAYEYVRVRLESEVYFPYGSQQVFTGKQVLKRNVRVRKSYAYESLCSFVQSYKYK